MNPRRIIVGVAVFLLALLSCLYLLFSGRQKSTGPPAIRPAVTEGDAAATQREEHVAGPAASSDGLHRLTPQQQEDRARGIAGALKSAQGPIEFYGRVVDDDGKGIPAADVQITMGYFSLAAVDDMFIARKEWKAKTDADGNFAVLGAKGYGLHVVVFKDGYIAYPDNPATFNADEERGLKIASTNPAIFRLRKRGRAEPLLRQRLVVRFPTNGAPEFADLLAGTTNSAAGDLKFQMWSDEEHKDSNFNYDWSVRIEVGTGGLIETNAPFAASAPESGYATTVVMDFPASLGKAWRENAKRSFFVRFRSEPTYAYMTVTAVPGGHALELEVRLNPSGSRNLEPDPQLLFRDLDSYNAFIAKRTGAATK